MKRLLLLGLLGLGWVCAARAQETRATGTEPVESTQGNSADTSAAKLALFGSTDATTFAAAPRSASSPLAGLSTAFATPTPAADPPPEPKFLYGGRDDYRWQLGIGADFIRFRSSIFNASAVGIKTSLTYFTNDWFAIEGNVSAAFAPKIFDREHVKLLDYGAGPKVAWRQKRWEPWLHAIFGGAHEQPQTAGNSKNSYSIQAGGGVDYRWNPRVSFRLEGNYVRTGFFHQSQNDLEVAGGIVFHF
jgi:opacity protein-like surface antigen